METIHLSNINLCPTMRCNLKCKLCGVLIPHYNYRPHMSIDEFCRTLSAIFEIVDSVGKLQITGGEPLLHTDLPVMLNECFKYSDQFQKLWLFTNCSVSLKSETLKVLTEYREKVVVHCSDYGARPEIAVQLVETLKKNAVNYKYLKYYGKEQYFDGWVDQGDFTKHNRNEGELKQVFRSCSHVKRGGSWYVRGGQMHWCGRSVRGCEVGKIPQNEKDFLNIFHGTVNDRRDRLSRLVNVEFITACDYCNGLYGTEDVDKRKPAGEQME